MANNPGHSEIIETVVDVRMLEVVAKPDKKSSDAATSSNVKDADEKPGIMKGLLAKGREKWKEIIAKGKGKRKMKEIAEEPTDNTKDTATSRMDLKAPSRLTGVKGFSERKVNAIETYCAEHSKSLNVVHDHGKSGFYKVPKDMRQRQGKERLYDPTYINFSKIRDMLEKDDPDVETRSLLNHYYYHFLGISQMNQKLKLEDHLWMIYEHREEIARCYGKEEADLDFLKLLDLLLSSCFVIYLFHISFHTGSIDIENDRECSRRWFEDLWVDMAVLEVAIENDRECYHRWVNDLWVDLLVLENQIPFFILKRVLDFLYAFPAFSWKYDKGRSRESPVMRVIPTATRLQEAGVQFRPAEKTGFVVEFKKGVLRLPRLHISKNTQKFFMNLIAWEHCHQPAAKYFINYVILMDQLINTPKDVEILIQNKVLEHSLETDKVVAAMFNSLGKDLIPTKNEELNNKYDFLEELSTKLNEYCGNKVNTWLAKLVADHFSSPWTIVSFIAAVLIIVFTLVQAFFSAFSYFRPPK
ncbi:UPF0481 protein At3g47200-like [Aristolochia californica]|uniref:UPF0481 protein At3g47200-like n=1 Tax=Aristolochia californica TaxID=171875 RepID=UPI0035DDDC0F